MRPRKILMPLLVLAFCGCANPADDKPEAEVGDAIETSGSTTAGRRFELLPESKVDFTGSKVTGSHQGGFRNVSGFIQLVDDDPTRSTIEVQIDATSLWSDTDRLTGHLKSPDFFDVEQHGTAMFESTEIVSGEPGYTIAGNLTLRGVTKNIRFPAMIVLQPERINAKAEFVLQRFDFGIEFPGKADDLIRDEVVVELDIIATPGT